MIIKKSDEKYSQLHPKLQFDDKQNCPRYSNNLTYSNSIPKFNHSNINKSQLNLNQINGKSSQDFQFNQKYALQLLLFEMELEDPKCYSQKISIQLYEMYKKGLEYCRLNKDPRENYFIKKMKILQTMSSFDQKQHLKENIDQKKKRFQKIISNTYQNIDDKISQFLHNAQLLQAKSKITTQIIQKNIKQQQQKINKRVIHRKQGSRIFSRRSTNNSEAMIDSINRKAQDSWQTSNDEQYYERII